MNELVSIIMPAYNTGKFIDKSILSVIGQTYTNWELIVVNDCSSDNTRLAINKYASDVRLRVFDMEKNVGAAECRNLGLRVAKGKWIAFLDSDDLWKPEKLERQINYMKQNDICFSYTNYEEIDVDDNLTGVKVTGPKKITKMGMYKYCWPGCLTVMYNSSKIGLIQINDIKKNNDYAMWLKVCRKADCYLLDEYLGMYRRGREGSISSHNITKKVIWHFRLFRNCEKMNVIKSLICTGINLVYGVYKKKKYVIR